MLKEHSYYSYLSTEDRMFLEFFTQPRRRAAAEFIRYYIRYQTFVGGEWKNVVEYDNCHDKMHQHFYDSLGIKGAAKILGPNDNPKRSFEELKEHITILYTKYKRWYHHQ